MKTICLRLHRGEDVLESIERLAAVHHLRAGCVLSAVGCVSRAVVRDAGGVQLCPIKEPLEIVSLMGTVSEARCHLHASFSREDLITLGGHLCHGCIVNTTCELVILELPGWRFGTEPDAATGYDEITMEEEP